MQDTSIKLLDINHYLPTKPEKKIITEEDINVFKKSPAFLDIMHFILNLQKAVQSKKISFNKNHSKFDPIIGLIQQLEALLVEVPPIHQQMRYGNKAFKDWMEKSKPLIQQYLDSQLPKNAKSTIAEVSIYIYESFGSPQRIDYGTGHEFSFILFLLCLFKLGIYDENDYEGLVHIVFYSYISMIRKVQIQYMLEPAGSHGVWGLDDYQFLPFLFGASELINNPYEILPEIIIKENLINRYKQDYMFLQCIDFINQVKKGPFHEHSPILYSLTSVSSWVKVTQGLVKMFQGEVLTKFPVIKHTYFGSFIKYESN